MKSTSGRRGHPKGTDLDKCGPSSKAEGGGGPKGVLNETHRTKTPIALETGKRRGVPALKLYEPRGRSRKNNNKKKKRIQEEGNNLPSFKRRDPGYKVVEGRTEDCSTFGCRSGVWVKEGTTEKWRGDNWEGQGGPEGFRSEKKGGRGSAMFSVQLVKQTARLKSNQG